ncbi:GerAB/ArcD/ProY family transporter [Gorillibacterium sp. CAU 1737]|uniref:GerAB/ArcD/ProY family transporter n=1 Tax=Gorillibacterium sp. CAU 1737 TaxID=3140362 RepID=UPI0032615383
MFTRTDDKITSTQASIFLTDAVLGAGILTLPRGVTEIVKTPDVWLSILFGGVVIILVVFIMTKLSQQFVGKTVFQYAKRIVGRIPGGILTSLLVIYFIVICGFEVRVLAEVTMYFLLEGTPIWGILMPFIWVSSYLILGGINSIARVFQIIFPISIFILIIAYILSTRIFDINNLRPVLSNGIMPVFSGLKSTILVYTGCEVVMVLVAHMQHPKQAVRAMITGISIPLTLYFITVVMVIGGMSVDAVQRSTWPTIDLLRSFEIAGLFFERFEFPFLVIWMMQLFCNFTSFFYSSSLGISQIFGLPFRSTVFGLMPVLFLAASIPQRINDVFSLGDYIGYASLGMFVLVPVLLSIVLLIRKKGLKQHV